MSINHFSSDLPEALWWEQPHHHTMELPSSSKPNTTSAAATNFWDPIVAIKPMSSAQNSALNFDLNNEDDEEITIDDERQLNHSFSSTRAAAEAEQEVREIPREPLFEKPLTPSDVGKLNRLVIPKQHAEKYFPLSGNGNGNDSGEKGLLLSFEDESGKPWRFRYSYWNSSQSYVLTKGWSRFVKEKRLDAGDIVLFERHRLDGDRLFIGWRRRSAAAAAAGNPAGQESTTGVGQAAAVVGGGGVGGSGWTRVYFPTGHPYPAQQQQQAHHHGPAFPYQPDCLHAAASVLQNQTTATSANSKRLRLFGVNLECQQQPDEYSESSEPLTPPEGSSTWSQLNHGQGRGHAHAQAHHQFQYYPKVHHAYFDHNNHMDINFSRDVNQTRYRQG